MVSVAAAPASWRVEELDPGRIANKGAVIREKMGGVCFVSSASPLSHNVSNMNLTTSPHSCMSNEALKIPKILLRECFTDRENLTAGSSCLQDSNAIRMEC